MNTIKATLFYNWNFMRALRLILAVMLTFQAVQMHDFFSGAIAGLLYFQSLTNTGCCGSGGCVTPFVKQDTQNNSGITYEEVSSKEPVNHQK